MTGGEVITLVTDLQPDEISSGWPADEIVGVTNVNRANGAVSCYLRHMVGDDSKILIKKLMSSFPSVERIAWAQGDDTSDSCTIEVYERVSDHHEQNIKEVLRVSSGIGNWRLARDAVREHCDVPVVTYHDIFL